MNLLSIILLLVFLSFFNKKYIPMLKINYYLKSYITAVKELSLKQEDIYQKQIILNRISLTGINLILRFTLFLISYIICFLFILHQNGNINIALFIPLISYIYLFISRK